MAILRKIGLDIGIKLAILGIKQWATNKYGEKSTEIADTIVDCFSGRIDNQIVLSVINEFSEPYGKEATLEDIAGYYLSSLKPEKVGSYIERCYQGKSSNEEANDFSQQLWLATDDIRNIVAEEDIRENAKFEEMCKSGLREAFLKITASPRFNSDTTRRIEKQLTRIESEIIPKERKFYPHFLTDEESSNRCWYRERELLDLQKILAKGERLILINGFGGVGKSTIAKELFHRIHANYSFAGFVTYIGNWIDSINSHFHSQSFPWGKNEETPEERFRAICNFLQDEPGTKLLVIDNYYFPGSDDTVLKNLAKKTDVTLIMTSRLSKLDKFVVFSADWLNKEDSVKLFLGYFEDGGGIIRASDQVIVEKLIYRVHRHTLAIELLAKTACECPYDLVGFCETISEIGIGYDDVDVQTEYAEATMKEHLKKLFDWHSLSAWGDKAAEMLRILRNLSLMPSISIPSEVETWISCQHSDLVKLDRAGWISFDRSAKTFYMHPLVKEILCLDKDQYGNKIGEEFLNCLSDRLFIKIGEESYNKVTVKLEIAESFILQQKGKTSKPYIGACSSLALCFGVYGEYIKEQQLSEYALQLGEQNLNSEDELLAQLYNNLASIYDGQGKNDEANCYYMKALEILASSGGETLNCIDYARICNNIALFSSHNGNFELAEKLYQEAIDVQEKYLGVEHTETAMSYTNLGGLYSEIGDFENEERCYLKAFDIRKKLFGEMHPEIANSYHNVASLFLKKGNYAKAEEYYHKAVSIRETMLGEMHEDTAASYYNLATLYKLSDRFAEADDFYKKTISIREHALGQMHPETALAHTGISLLYNKQGRLSEAETHALKAIEILGNVRNGKTLALADAYSALASIYEAQGNYPKAEELFQQTLETQINILGDYHPTIAITYENLANVFAMIGKLSEAEELYKKAKEINESVWGEQHLNTAVTYNNLACFYQMQKQYDRAEIYCQKAVAIRQAQLGVFHTETATALHNLGTIWYGQERYNEAVDLFLFSLYVCCKKLGSNHKNTIASLQWLAKCFDNINHPDNETLEEWLKKELARDR